jgi:hypothetical protein
MTRPGRPPSNQVTRLVAVELWPTRKVSLGRSTKELTSSKASLRLAVSLSRSTKELTSSKASLRLAVSLSRSTKELTSSKASLRLVVVEFNPSR